MQDYPPTEDTYRTRAVAWANHHMLCNPQDYARAAATWRMWQSNPVHLEGAYWVRANGERTPAYAQPQARRNGGSNGHGAEPTD